MKTKPKVAIVAGGYSGEYEVSIRSAEGLLSWIDRNLYDPYLVLIGRDGRFVLPAVKDTKNLERAERFPLDLNIFGFCPTLCPADTIRFDYALITIHGTPGENGLLQGYLDIMGIPYNTCGVLVEALTFDKYANNRYLSLIPGINVAANRRLFAHDPMPNPAELCAELGLPLFVKPNLGGSSLATTKVKEVDALLPAIHLAFDEAPEVLIESLLLGTEVTCGCYRSRDPQADNIECLRVLPVSEVIAKNEFFDYEAKYQGAVEEITPARISPELTSLIQSLTKSIYSNLAAKGIIRVDYIINADGKPFLLEVNTTPGMTPTSFIPQQVQAAGLDMMSVLTDIISQDLEP